MKSFYQKIDIAQLKEAIDPIDFYTSEGQNIKTKGASPWKEGGLCPFHDDQHASSFYINDTSGAFSCFSCETSGSDIIHFVQKKYGLSFGDTIRKLERQWRLI